MSNWVQTMREICTSQNPLPLTLELGLDPWLFYQRPARQTWFNLMVLLPNRLQYISLIGMISAFFWCWVATQKFKKNVLRTDPRGLAGPKSHILQEFDPQMVDYICRQLWFNLFLAVNAPIDLVLGSWHARASGSYSEATENGFLLFVRPLKFKQLNLFKVFQLSSKLNMGF